MKVFLRSVKWALLYPIIFCQIYCFMLLFHLTSKYGFCNLSHRYPVWQVLKSTRTDPVQQWKVDQYLDLPFLSRLSNLGIEWQQYNWFQQFCNVQSSFTSRKTYLSPVSMLYWQPPRSTLNKLSCHIIICINLALHFEVHAGADPGEATWVMAHPTFWKVNSCILLVF